MKPILTPWQELNARTLGKFIGLAREDKYSSDFEHYVQEFIKLADEYTRKDEELLNDLPRSG